MRTHVTRLILLVSIVAACICTPALGQTQTRSTSSAYAWVIHNCRASNGWCGWQNTVNCENRGHWYDSPGYFYYGVQFDPGSMATSEAHTGVTVTAWPPTQIVNARWLLANSHGDPWPNCPQPGYPGTAL